MAMGIFPRTAKRNHKMELRRRKEIKGLRLRNQEQLSKATGTKGKHCPLGGVPPPKPEQKQA